MSRSKRILFPLIKVLLLVILVLIVGMYIFFSIHTRVTANLDTYEYSLPFKKATKHKVAQGYGGLFSHKYIAAIDFAMPVGTPICAARGGVIYAYKDDSDKGGPWSKYKSKANYIIIKHDDGSFGCYWHLKKNGVLVKRGRVTEGQQIGLSGATGQVFRPHLHFSVKLRLNYDMNSFTRTKFRTTDGVILLKKGSTYGRPGSKAF